jgi:tetratricopeptide (TPR) repeat protein
MGSFTLFTTDYIYISIERSIKFVETKIMNENNTSNSSGNDHFKAGSDYLDQGQFLKAKIELCLALEKHKENNKPLDPIIAEDLTLLGITYWNLVEVNLAHQCFYEALEIDKINYKHNDHKVIRNINNLGLINKSFRRLKQAIWHFERALMLSTLDSPIRSDYHINLAISYGALNKLKEVKENLVKAIELDESNNDDLGLAKDLMYQGFLLNKFENSNIVVDKLNQALDIFEKNNKILDTAYCLGYLGDANKKDKILARQYYIKALEIFTDILGTKHPNIKLIEYRLSKLQ